jgi:hypothetical protein
MMLKDIFREVLETWITKTIEFGTPKNISERPSHQRVTFITQEQ